MGGENSARPGACCRRFLVRGRVQRVGFRASTRRRADELGLAGYARNLADGRVEVVAAGTPEAVAALAEWLAEGPMFARVDAVLDDGEAEVPPGPFHVA